jgi:ABC-2 type transport system permease protein
MFRVELGKAFHRIRTYVLGTLLAAVAILPVLVFALSHDNGQGGTPFFQFLRTTGLFAPLAVLVLMQPFILPLGAGLLSGEAVALEASNGTLRYLLVRPVGRIALVLQKYGAVMTLLSLAVVWIMTVALAAGAIAFGLHPMPTLSGTALALGPAIARVLLAGCFVIGSIAGLAAIGTFLSTLTESAPVATVATVGLVILFQILDNLSSLHAIHPYLLTHDWLAYADLFRSPIEWSSVVHGAIVFAVYTAAFLGAGLATFSRKDIAT